MRHEEMQNYINVGCGMSPTEGWTNFDNSWSIRISRKPIFVSILKILRLVNASQLEYINFARNNKIYWADAVEHLPLSDGSVDVIYTSHMLEHLEKAKARSFLREAGRVLKSGGIIRIAVPDLRVFVERYIEDKDADKFVEKLHMSKNSPDTFAEKIKYLFVGDRHHKWMYDGASLSNLLNQLSFRNPIVLEAGMTTIPNPGTLNLREREEESLYIEATKS